ncbi:unnamed protein product [Adineta steineri]|uniref:Hexosyltransferase n=1 Tax=Adineta steineri TaxID=433720 RepID=A0A814ZW47_9BILA|nr:unnamed protein product [Adineta steineri]CAF1376133.1 unnamed protein product [Adineta steineri]CAF3762407.1 unnamed protein product [Adineta steineri]
MILLFIACFIHIYSINSQNTSVTVPTIKNPYTPRDHIVNPHNFSYILNPGYSICNSSNPFVFVFIYVHSGPGNYQRRVVIRETWATRTLFPDIRLIFMIGKTLDKNLMKAIEYENEIYRDIVQEDFIDSYKNLTYKGIMALKWISTYCSNTKYILKVDDDIVVNTFTLLNHLKFLEKHTTNGQHNTILCLVWTAMMVMRDSKSKWYLSKSDFPFDTFPPYCSGSAFILTGDMPTKMYNASLYVPFFWVDDYYITGAVASAANATYAQLGSLYTIPEQLAHTRFMSAKSFYTIMFGHFPTSLNNMREIWKRILTLQKYKFPNRVQLNSFSWDETIHQPDKATR